jgi:hypothetical protein
LPAFEVGISFGNVKLTTTLRSTQAFRVVFLPATLLVVFACSSQRVGVDVAAPSDPDDTIHQFMRAVAANDLVAMGSLWGTAQGPASRNMDREELQQRLTIMRSYLVYERYQVIQGDPSRQVAVGANERLYRVQLHRRGCVPEVPFSLVRSGDGWLVRNIDLSQAGNPARRCEVRPGGTRP